LETLRTAASILTGEPAIFEACDCTAATPDKPWVSKELDIAGSKIAIAVASGLENTATLLDALKAGEVHYDFVEIMACPGGCIDGGGQPLHHGNGDIIKARWEAIYQADKNMPLRKSHENPSIQTLYKEFLGEPCGHKSHELLHTHYFDRQTTVEVDLNK
jgi:NADH-quinone oxidoreductase subunit G